MEIANKDPELLPVLREYVGFVEAKQIGRGLRAGREQLVRAAVEYLCDMFTDPIKWARRRQTEFREDPDGVVLFADHWRRQYEALKGALEQTRPIYSAAHRLPTAQAIPKLLRLQCVTERLGAAVGEDGSPPCATAATCWGGRKQATSLRI